MRTFRASALLLALVMPTMAMLEIRQGGTQGWELRSVSLNELSKLGLATGPSNRRPIFQNLDGGPPHRHHGGAPPGFQQVQLLGGGPGPRGPPRGFPGANISLDNLFARAQVHRRPQPPPQLGPPAAPESVQGLNGLRLPPGWQAIQIDANQFSSIASGKPINIPGLSAGSVQIDTSQQHFNQARLPGSQGIQIIQSGPSQGPQQGGQVLQLPNNKLEIPQNTPTFQHGPFRIAHVSEEVHLIGQNGQKTIEVPVGTGHDQIKQVVQQQSEPQSNTVPASEGGNIIPGGLPAAIQQFLKDNTPQFQLHDEEEAKGEQEQLRGHQVGHQSAQQATGAPLHVPQHQIVQHQQQQQQQHHQLQQAPAPVRFQQQVHQQLPISQALVQPAGPQGEPAPIGNIPPGWKVIRVTADQLAAYQRDGPAAWLANNNQNTHQHQQTHVPQEHHQRAPQHVEPSQSPPQIQHLQHEQRGNFEAQGRSELHGFHGHSGHASQGPSESYQPPSQAAPPVRIPPRANVKVVYLPLSGSTKTVQHQQPLYHEERREQPRQQQGWQPPAIEHGAWKAITPNYVQQNSNAPWKQSPANNGGQAYATSERYHQRGNHFEEHRHEHPPSNRRHNNPHNNDSSGHRHSIQEQDNGGQRARGVVTRENAQKWF